MHSITEKKLHLILRRTLTLKGLGAAFDPPSRFFPSNSGNTEDTFLKLCDFSPIPEAYERVEWGDFHVCCTVKLPEAGIFALKKQ